MHRDEMFRGTTLVSSLPSFCIQATGLSLCVTCRQRHILLLKHVSDMQLRWEIRFLPFLKRTYSR